MQIKLSWMCLNCPKDLINKEVLVHDFYDLPRDQSDVPKASSPTRSKRMQKKTKKLLENLNFSDDSEPSPSASPITLRTFSAPKTNMQPRVVLKNLNSQINEGPAEPTVDLNSRIQDSEPDKVWFYHYKVFDVPTTVFLLKKSAL